MTLIREVGLLGNLWVHVQRMAPEGLEPYAIGERVGHKLGEVIVLCIGSRTAKTIWTSLLMAKQEQRLSASGLPRAPVPPRHQPDTNLSIT